MINQSILPIPISRNPVDAVPYGFNQNMKNYGVYKDYRNQYPTYCTTLPPPPRDQIQYQKYFRQTKCAYLPKTQFNNNQCYFLEPNPTGPVDGRVGGYFCGGSNNLNYARGNIFAGEYRRLAEKVNCHARFLDVCSVFYRWNRTRFLSHAVGQAKDDGDNSHRLYCSDSWFALLNFSQR